MGATAIKARCASSLPSSTLAGTKSGHYELRIQMGRSLCGLSVARLMLDHLMTTEQERLCMDDFESTVEPVAMYSEASSSVAETKSRRTGRLCRRAEMRRDPHAVSSVTRRMCWGRRVPSGKQLFRTGGGAPLDE